MSAVTLSEIADLTAARLRVPVAAMRGLSRGRASDAEIARVRTARNVVIVLARRHTQASFPTIASFFGLALHGSTRHRLREVVSGAEPGWLSADAELHAAVEEIEQQIDALHERRLALRDRREVRA